MNRPEKEIINKELEDITCLYEVTKLLASSTDLHVSLERIMEILTELQDVSRFATADQIAAFLGLTPSQYSSGQHVRMGKITHAGNHRLRTRMVECSWIAIKKDPGLNKTYQAIKTRRGGKRAIVAVSRKLIIRIRRILLDEVTYRKECAIAA